MMSVADKQINSCEEAPVTMCLCLSLYNYVFLAARSVCMIGLGRTHGVNPLGTKAVVRYLGDTGKY